MIEFNNVTNLKRISADMDTEIYIALPNELYTALQAPSASVKKKIMQPILTEKEGKIQTLRQDTLDHTIPYNRMTAY